MPSTSGGESDTDNQKKEIREELSSMTFQELMQLKEELGSKVYKEAILGTESGTCQTNTKGKFKRLNKNRPREQSSRYEVPFLGSRQRSQKRQDPEANDPRFDESAGTYDSKEFKENYKFLTHIRRREIIQLKKQLNQTKDLEEKKNIKLSMQRLINKNVEEKKWHEKQSAIKEEKMEILKARSEGRTPHYTTKKERRAKELVKQFETLKKTGALSKHLEKRRKKNAAKDRKKLNIE